MILILGKVVAILPSAGKAAGCSCSCRRLLVLHACRLEVSLCSAARIAG